MNKRLKYMIVVLAVCVLLFQTNITNANNERNYTDMISDWQQNNIKLKDLALDLADEERAYQAALEQVESAKSSWSDMVSQIKKMGREIPAEMKLNIIIRRDIAKEQADLDYEKSKIEYKALKNELVLELRNEYLAYQQIAFNVEQLELEEQIKKIELDQAEIQYQQGIIGEQQLWNIECLYLDLQNRLIAEKRQFVIAQQLLNAMVGMPLDTVYEVKYVEPKSNDSLKQVEHYIETALINRVDAQEYLSKIIINELHFEAYNKYFEYKDMNEDMQESFDERVEAQKYTELQYQKLTTAIEKEIRNLYLDVIYKSKIVKNALNKRNDYAHQRDAVQSTYIHGSATKKDLLQAELQYLRAQNDYNMAIYQYNTSLEQLKYASDAGIGTYQNSSFSTLGGSYTNMSGGI